MGDYEETDETLFPGMDEAMAQLPGLEDITVTMPGQSQQYDTLVAMLLNEASFFPICVRFPP